MKNRLPSNLTSVIFCFITQFVFAQAPDLGGAAKFVLFSSTGAVTNSGTGYLTHLTGDVGADNGAITGFGNVNGVMHNADSATGKAKTDLLKAYNQLDTTTSTISHAPLLGGGETLNAGVYAIAGNTSLNLDLILDGLGNENAVFIFKIAGTLSTGSQARIVLINGAVACHVFWKVDGAITLGSPTIMRGTMISTAAITMTAGDTLEGRALSTTGAISTNTVVAYTPIGCGSALLTGPAAPNFGTAGCFAIFSGNGNITNSDTSHVTGDIGTNAGSTNGYNPLFVTGYIHPGPDSYTAAANTALAAAYTYLNTLPVDIELLYPAQFGRDLVLTPHTYLMSAATTFTDALYLDGQGNYNAVFVIKIQGAISTSTLSTVYLVNGTQAKNVYWVVNGAVSINVSSVFNGTIVCNGPIDLGSNVTLNGRALVTSGGLSTSKIIATSPSGNCNVLPVSWLYFNGKPGNENVQLEWGTSNEINNGYFTIYKSSDGITFKTLATVNATGGTGRAEYHYTYTDLQPYSLGYYRISQSDRDGKKNYFRTIKVRANVNPRLEVLTYAQQNYIHVQASGWGPSNGLIELYNLEGRKVASQKILLTREASKYTIEKALNKGIYLLNIISEGNKLYQGKVMVP